MDTTAQTTGPASVRLLPLVAVRVALAVVIVAALSGCDARYECTTALDSGTDIPWDFWTEFGTAVAAAAAVGAVAGAMAIGGPLGVGIALGVGMAVAFNAGHAIGHIYGDQIMGAIFGGGGGHAGWFPGRPGPTDVAPGDSGSGGWSGSRNADTGVPGQSSPPSADAASGSTPDAGSAGGTQGGGPDSGGSNVTRDADTTANAPVDSSDGLSIGELFHGQGVDVGGGSTGGANPSGPGGSGTGTGGGTQPQSPPEELTLGKLLDMQMSDDAREVVETINLLNR